MPQSHFVSGKKLLRKLGPDHRKEEREAALAAAAAAKKADLEAPVIVKEILSPRKRGAAHAGLQQQHQQQPPPPLRRFKSVQGGKEVLLHVGAGDSAEALLDRSGFKLYKRHTSEPLPARWVSITVTGGSLTSPSCFMAVLHICRSNGGLRCGVLLLSHSLIYLSFILLVHLPCYHFWDFRLRSD